jgi:ATP-binding cassette subfamily B protein/subfamily B ATP-binding cassette protein MsbA
VGGDRRIALWFWRGFARRRAGLLLAAALLMSVEGATVGAVGYLVQPLFDGILAPSGGGSFGWAVAAIAGAFVLRAVAGFGQRVLFVSASERIAADLQAAMMAHLMRLDLAFYRANPPGALIDRVRGDAVALRELLAKIVAGVARDGVALLALFGVALWMDPLWTALAVVGVPMLVLPVIAVQRLLRRTVRAARAASGRVVTHLDEVFHGIVTVQLAGTAGREAGRFRAALAAFRRLQVRGEAAAAATPAMVDIVAALGFAAVLTWGSREIAGGGKTVGEFMAFFTALGLAFDPLRKLGAVAGLGQAALALLERMEGIMAWPVAITDPVAPVAPPPGPPAIAFEGVTFAYDGGPVLRGLTFLAEAGRTTAIVGPSGAGKSTVFALIARLADPQAGRVTLGGVEVQTLRLAELRGMLSVVSQDTALFDATLQENIALGQPEDAARMAWAVAAAGVGAFLPALPAGLDTLAGPRGSALSGGQRQRVAIARALLRDAPVLLLDEATSALDAETETAVQAALERLATGRTTLVIAHRLATVRRADRIIVMDAGRVVESGTHAELLDLGGLYARLCALQFSEA